MSAWNKLFGNQKDSTLNSSGVVTTTTTFDPNQLAAAGQAINPFIGGAQQVQHNKFGGLSAQQVQGILTTFSTLSPEEKAELENLKKEYEISVKVAKLDEFKKLPTELRQFIINVISWKEAKEKIEAAHPDKPDRLKELENKENNSNLMTQFGHSINIGQNQWYSSHTSSVNLDFMELLPIPEGVTAEELKEAHVEATLEEEMLDE